MSAGQGDAWFFAMLFLGLLLAFGAVTGLEGNRQKWALRVAAYLLVLPPLALFWGAVAMGLP